MTGLTTEIHSIHSALDRVYNFCTTTHKKAPQSYILGPEEHDRYEMELEDLAKYHVRDRKNTGREYFGVPVIRSEKPGIDFKPPPPNSSWQ